MPGDSRRMALDVLHAITQRARHWRRPLLALVLLAAASGASAEARMGASAAGTGAVTASATLNIQVVVPAFVRIPAAGGAIGTNLGGAHGAQCVLTLVEGAPKPADLPRVGGMPCGVNRVTREAVAAGAFTGVTLMP